MKRLMFAVAAGMILAGTVLVSTAQATDAILLEFSSPHCAPCQAMKPTLMQMERAGVPIRHIDVVAEPHLASRYGIRKTPTFVVVSGGKEVTRLIGSQTAQRLHAALAIDPSGPLIPTRSTLSESGDIPAPQTRLAPVLAPRNARPAGVPQPIPLANSAPRANQNTLANLASAKDRSFRGEPMPNLSIADAVQRARAATVRLRVHDGHGHGAGTGTIIDVHGQSALVLTCGHLFRESKGEGKIEVDLFFRGQTKTVLGKVLDYDADNRDIALVEIQPGFQVQPIEVVGYDQRVENGMSAFSFGCDHGEDPTRRDTRIEGVNKINQHLGVSNLTISGAPVGGRSGGGLFDASGRLIGVCNSADYKNDVGIYAGPGTIAWQLDRFGLQALYQSDQAPAQLAAAAPVTQVASLQEANPRPAGRGSLPFSEAALGPDQEVIVIVRERGNPNATSQVMTLHEPTADLMNQIQRQAR